MSNDDIDDTEIDDMMQTSTTTHDPVRDVTPASPLLIVERRSTTTHEGVPAWATIRRTAYYGALDGDGRVRAHQYGDHWVGETNEIVHGVDDAFARVERMLRGLGEPDAIAASFGADVNAGALRTEEGARPLWWDRLRPLPPAMVEAILAAPHESAVEAANATGATA